VSLKSLIMNKYNLLIVKGSSKTAILKNVKKIFVKAVVRRKLIFSKKRGFLNVFNDLIIGSKTCSQILSYIRYPYYPSERIKNKKIKKFFSNRLLVPNGEEFSDFDYIGEEFPDFDYIGEEFPDFDYIEEKK
jgi:hypothetical protein